MAPFGTIISTLNSTSTSAIVRAHALHNTIGNTLLRKGNNTMVCNNALHTVSSQKGRLVCTHLVQKGAFWDMRSRSKRGKSPFTHLDLAPSMEYTGCTHWDASNNSSMVLIPLLRMYVLLPLRYYMYYYHYTPKVCGNVHNVPFWELLCVGTHERIPRTHFERVWDLSTYYSPLSEGICSSTHYYIHAIIHTPVGRVLLLCNSNSVTPRYYVMVYLDSLKGSKRVLNHLFWEVPKVIYPQSFRILPAKPVVSLGFLYRGSFQVLHVSCQNPRNGCFASAPFIEHLLSDTCYNTTTW